MKIGYLKKRGRKMINKNKAPNHSNELVIVHRKCITCKQEITEDLRVPNYGGVGYQKMCRTCRNAKSLKSSRRKAKILRDNPLW